MQRAGIAPWSIAILFVALAVAGCAGAPPPQITATPPAQPTDAPATATDMTAPPLSPNPASAEPQPTDTATPAPSAVGGGLAAELIDAGQLTICSSFPRVRFAEYDAAGNPFGVDIDLGIALAEEMDLDPVVSEIEFDGLIDAVVNRQCDVSVSGQFITAQRLEQIEMLAYREGSVSPVVRTGNPMAIELITDLCGRTAAIVQGTIYVDLMRGAGEYAGSGVDQQCSAADLPPVELDEHATEDDAVAALAAGDADAFIGNEAIVLERPDDFELVAAALPPLRNGIGYRHGASALDEALTTALRAVIADGTYAAILDRYGVGDIGVTEVP